MKMVIVGAGATAYSRWANPQRRPPLSNEDILRMFNKPSYHIPTIDAAYNQFFCKALKLYENNIEALFTGIYILSKRDLNINDEKLLMLEKLGHQYILDIKDKIFSNILFFFKLNC